MLTTRTIEETRSAIRDALRRGATIGFVPTMGFLHEGHLSLVDVARGSGADFIVASIFVNPLQFGPAEDFSRYPRNEEGDASMLEKRSVDLLFLPEVAAMIPAVSQTRLTVGAVAQLLEGVRRPGHFEGVATIVAKLLNIVQPDLAAFGRKDAQQCAVIEQMVRDLDIPVRLVFGDTIREADGLAMSSRNSYLSADERRRATTLYRALRAGQDAILHRVHSVEAVEQMMRGIASETAGVEIDYLALVDPRTFQPPADFDRDLLLTGAVRIGRTRLIDNLRVPLQN